ncbi:unnamed protein product [Leptosia nina]|uniref:Gamma-interferon-inducible lysosomal thiol reductase n=1 Tax=Leptosia nina TaxID=320188 RepID=A0AAV1IVW8_9NEOP
MFARPNWGYYHTQNEPAGENVDVKLFYEAFCPHCRVFDTEQFRPVVERLGQYLDITTYPYGNAQTIEKDGETSFICQNGPDECYGNKLHACALHEILNKTTALIFNACMMEFSQEDRGSDDKAADACGKSMNIDSKPIKRCAKGPRGVELLKYYGEESKKVNFKHVPHILINGVQNDGKHFARDVCAALAAVPPECADLL